MTDTTPRLPLALPLRQVMDALASMHIHVRPEDLRQAVIGPQSIVVTLLRRDARGHLIAAGDEAATTVVTIAIEHDDA